MICNPFRRSLPPPAAPLTEARRRAAQITLAAEAVAVDAASLAAGPGRNKSGARASEPFALRLADTHDDLAAMARRPSRRSSGPPGQSG